MNYGLISSILRGAWAIKEDFVDAYSPFIFQLLNGIDTQFENNFSGLMPKVVNPVTGTHFEYDEESDAFTGVTEGSVLIIPVKGTLMKNDQECGPVGTETLRSYLKAAADNPKIIAAVLHTDSPGGTVDGTMQFGEEINAFKAKGKPVVDFIDGMEASAALWIGSHADYRIASTELDEIGSIGVMMSFWDIIPYYEKEGLKYHQVVSNLSEDKTKMFDDLRAGKYEEYKKEVLDPIAEEFHNTISKNLPKVSKDMMTGKVYLARDVMGIMVDEIGTLDDAIKKAASLAKKSTNSNSNKKSVKTMKFKHVATLLALAAIELDAENTASLTEEQLEAIDAALADRDTQASALETAQNDLSAKATELENLTASHAEEIETLNAEHASALQEKDDQITALQNGAGASGGKVISKTDPDAEEDTGDDSVAKGVDFGADLDAVKKEYGIE